MNTSSAATHLCIECQSVLPWTVKMVRTNARHNSQPLVGHQNCMSACHQRFSSFSEYLDVTAMSSRAGSRKTNPYDSPTLTSMNQIAYMVTPLEDPEPPCEQKALVWSTSLKEVPEFNHSRWHLHPKSLTTFGHSSIT